MHPPTMSERDENLPGDVNKTGAADCKEIREIIRQLVQEDPSQIQLPPINPRLADEIDTSKFKKMISKPTKGTVEFWWPKGLGPLKAGLADYKARSDPGLETPGEVCVDVLIFSPADEGGVLPAQDVADLCLPVLGQKCKYWQYDCCIISLPACPPQCLATLTYHHGLIRKQLLHLFRVHAPLS